MQNFKNKLYLEMTIPFVLRKNTDTFQCQMVIINQICSWMCLDEETFCTLLQELMELELSLPRPSSVTISYTIFEKELVPFQFHQNWNQFRNLELLVPLHNTTGVKEIAFNSPTCYSQKSAEGLLTMSCRSIINLIENFHINTCVRAPYE